MAKRKYFKNGLAISDREALDNNGVIRPGVSLRVPMQFADAVQRDVAANSKRAVIKDSLGGHKPGFRISDAIDHSAAEEARREWLNDMQNAWRTDARKAKAKEPDEDNDDENENENEEEEERETSDSAKQRLNDAYRSHDEYLRQAWRAGK